MQPQLNYGAIAEHLGDKPIVGFGESTHGTHEFFETKSEVFKALVAEHGFNTLFFESIDDAFDDVNTYLQTGEGKPEKLINKLFYVYRTQEVLDLLKWLREQHDVYPVQLVGIDERQHVRDYENYDLAKVNLRDKRMALVVKNYMASNPASKGMIWAHDTHVTAYLNQPEWAEGRLIPMGEHLRKWFGKDYFSVSQLFGSGYFSAALIEESGEFDNSVLVSHFARKTSKYFWENKLAKVLFQATFLEAPDYGGLVEEGETHYKRALGWGVKRSVMHDNGNVAYVNLGRAYDGLTFFPRTSASHRLP